MRGLVKIMFIKDIGLLAIGGILGAVIMDWYGDHKRKKLVEDTLRDVSEGFEEDYEDWKNKQRRKDETVMRKPYVVKRKDFGRDRDLESYNKISSKYGASIEEVGPVDDEEPYLIDFDQFGAEEDKFDKLTVYFYKKDLTMTDDQDTIMEDVNEAVGDINLLIYAGNDVVYIRNERLSIDYEIIVHDGSYKELVLGERDG
jgi:hypothetical protein